MCASGVIMCRMFLAIVPPQRSLNLDVVFLADLGAVIPCAADLDLDFSLGAGALSEKFRVIGVGCKAEAGRAPGALADSVCARSFQTLGYLANWPAGEATATLNRRKMIADDLLKPSDASAERLDILFGQSRQDLHQRAAADLA